MSSNAYSSCLKPDPWLRIAVVISAQMLIFAGMVLILTLSLNAAARGIACALWVAYGWFELRRLRRGYESCREIRLLAGGDALVLTSAGQWVSGVVLSGSVVLKNLAWLRLRTAEGAEIVELLRGDGRRCHDWRRLQVIWRHIGAG